MKMRIIRKPLSSIDFGMQLFDSTAHMFAAFYKFFLIGSNKHCIITRL